MNLESPEPDLIGCHLSREKLRLPRLGGVKSKVKWRVNQAHETAVLGSGDDYVTI